MSLHLDNGTVPHNLLTKAALPYVLIGDYRLSLVDFLVLAQYVLENDDLEGPDDPRLVFVEGVRALVTKPGWNRGKRRLQLRRKKYAPRWQASKKTRAFAALALRFVHECRGRGE